MLTLFNTPEGRQLPTRQAYLGRPTDEVRKMFRSSRCVGTTNIGTREAGEGDGDKPG